MSANIYKYMDLSIGHLTKEDYSILKNVKIHNNRDSWAVSIAVHAYGIWVWVPDKEDILLYEEMGLEHGLSASLFKVIRYARRHGCNWINFDGDAENCDELEVFDW